MTENGEVPVSGAMDDSAEFAEITGNPAFKSPPQEVAQADPPQASEPVAEAPQQQPEQQETPRVPLAELKAEREKRQQYERELAEMRGRLQAMERFAAPQASQSEQPPPDIFENPAAFVQQAIQPQQQMLLYNARLVAEARFGEKETNEAIEAFDSLMAQRAIHPAEIQRVMSSPNPFAEAVKWHKQHKIVSEIGTDPNAYRERLLADALNDPAFRQKAMESWRGQAAQQPNNGQARAPVVNLPSLSKVGAAALPQAGPPSDDDDWSQITARRR